uniref:Putative ubiquitin-protein ligase/hyperplastic discs protein n=1 Tax=Anopheles marajoara TaxID=58244 RepID=A0A2M4BGK6_9DIPT
MDVAPSMVQRSGDKLIVRRVVSGERVHLGEPDEPIALHHQHQQQQVLLEPGWRQTLEDTPFGTGGSSSSPPPPSSSQRPDGITEMDRNQQPARDVPQQDEQHLPQCKIKRNYSCGRCTYFTQNPRKYLTHLRDTHGEKIVINECKRCLYASRHYQKLVRHMKMVHGSVDGIKKSGASFSSTSSFGGRRNRIQRSTGYLSANEVLHHHGGSSGSGGNARFLMRTTDADRELATAYVQQLVAASGLPKLLEEMERSVASTSIGASKGFIRGCGSSDAEELHQLNQIMPYSSETIQEAARRQRQRRQTTNEDNDNDADNDDDDDDDDGDEDDGRLLDNAVSTEEEEADTKPKKRPRPIPNLIPLSAQSSSPATSGQAKGTENLSRRFVKPLPLSALTADSAEEPTGTQIVLTRCVYCELSFKTVESLANHIKLAHKEDLIAALLQSSFEETEPAAARIADGNTTPTTTTTTTTVNMWQRLLDCSAEVRRAELERSSSSNSNSNNTTNSNRTGQSGRVRTSVTTAEEGQDDDSGREGDDHQQHQDQHQQQQQQQTYCGIETAPGYGEVISRVPVDPGTSNALMKKVFKCPHCSFWASTASRFHVHIVGHLNKKPFECSLCAYRSNWRWDITKHIRLKTIRDPSHKNAGVLMNDETGRRNYTKYNKYMALMQITDK